MDIIQRMNTHLEELRKGTHDNYKLQDSFNKYGEDNFEFYTVCVFDKSITDDTDPITLKCLLIISENKYILKFNTIENGYNIENTLKEILVGNKNIKVLDTDREMNTKESLRRIKDSLEKYKFGVVKEFGGILYKDLYRVDKIAHKYNLSKDKFNKLLLGLGLYEFNNRVDSFRFTEGIEIIKTEDYHSKRKFISKEDYQLICDRIESSNINDSIAYGNLIISEYKKGKKERHKKVVVEEVNKEIKDEVEKTKVVNNSCIEEVSDLREYKFIEYIDKNIKDNTFRKYIDDNFDLICTYNSIFAFFRDNGILKYIMYNNKKVNIPTEEYQEHFYICIYETDGKENMTGLMIRNESKSIISDIMIKNNLVTPKNYGV